MHPSPGCVLPYRLRQKFDYDDDIIIVLEAMLKKINYVWKI